MEKSRNNLTAQLAPESLSSYESTMLTIPDFPQPDLPEIRSCFKIILVSAGSGQGKNRRESAVYTRVNEHFEPIVNAVMCQSRGVLKQLLRLFPPDQ